MATLTISTDGVRDLIGGGPVIECHKGDIDAVRHYGERLAQTVTLTLDPVQALGLAVDLLYQLVDAGVIAGWNTQFPETDSKEA